MAAKFTRMTHKIAIRLHLVTESCTMCSSCSRRPVRKLLDTPSSSAVDVTALGYGLDDRRFESRQGLGIVLFTTASRPALGPTPLPIQWVLRALSLWVKQPARETDHSPPSCAEVKNAWSYASTTPICLHGVVLH
jgi:hypothetical protein